MKRLSMAWIVASGAVLMALGMGAEAQAHTLAVRFAPAANATRTSKAGYELAHPPASASASDHFTVPTLTCPSTGTYGIALGAFLFTSLGLTGAEVTAECSSGTAVYTAQWLEHGVSGGAFTVAAGDIIEAQGSQTATMTNAGIVDRTKRFGTEFGSFVGATNSSVLVGMHSLLSSSNTRLPVPPFGTERFHVGTIDGGTVLASGAVAEDMQTSTHILQIHTSALSSTGKAWSEVFKHS